MCNANRLPTFADPGEPYAVPRRLRGLLAAVGIVAASAGAGPLSKASACELQPSGPVLHAPRAIAADGLMVVGVECHEGACLDISELALEDEKGARVSGDMRVIEGTDSLVLVWQADDALVVDEAYTLLVTTRESKNDSIPDGEHAFERWKIRAVKSSGKSSLDWKVERAEEPAGKEFCCPDVREPLCGRPEHCFGEEGVRALARFTVEESAASRGVVLRVLDDGDRAGSDWVWAPLAQVDLAALQDGQACAEVELWDLREDTKEKITHCEEVDFEPGTIAARWPELDQCMNPPEDDRGISEVLLPRWCDRVDGASVTSTQRGVWCPAASAERLEDGVSVLPALDGGASEETRGSKLSGGSNGCSAGRTPASTPVTGLAILTGLALFARVRRRSRRLMHRSRPK